MSGSAIQTVSFYRIKSAHSGLYVVAKDPSSDDSHLVQQPLNEVTPAAFQWGFISVGGGAYRIFNGYRGYSIDAEGNSTKPGDGTHLQQYSWKPGQGNQQWYWNDSQRAFESFYTPNKVWDVKGNSTKAGADIQLHSYNGGNNQQWILEPVAASTVPLSADALAALSGEEAPAA
jgi:hypothetical protein